MKHQHILGVFAFTIIAMGVIGCGGSSAAGGSISRETSRAKVAEALKGAAESSSTSRNLGRKPKKAGAFSLGNFQTLLASGKAKGLTRDGGGDTGGDGGIDDGTSGGSDGGTTNGGDDGIGENPETELKLGDRIEKQLGYYGIVTAVERDFSTSFLSYSTLKYDIFFETNPAVVGRYERVISQDGGVRNELQFTEITEGPQKGFYMRNQFSNNPATGGRTQDYEVRTILEFEGKTFLNRIKTKVNFPGPGSPYDFEYDASFNGVDRYTAGKYFPDGRVELTWTNSNNYRVAWVQNADLSGTVTITNPNDPLMPATGVFNAEGVGTLTFADGTTGSFDLYSENFWN